MPGENMLGICPVPYPICSAHEHRIIIDPSDAGVQPELKGIQDKHVMSMTNYERAQKPLRGTLSL